MEHQVPAVFSSIPAASAHSVTACPDTQIRPPTRKAFTILAGKLCVGVTFLTYSSYNCCFSLSFCIVSSSYPGNFTCLFSVFHFLHTQYLPGFLVLSPDLSFFRLLISRQKKKNQREPTTFPSAMLRITSPIPFTRPILRIKIA